MTWDNTISEHVDPLECIQKLYDKLKGMAGMPMPVAEHPLIRPLWTSEDEWNEYTKDIVI